MATECAHDFTLFLRRNTPCAFITWDNIVIGFWIRDALTCATVDTDVTIGIDIVITRYGCCYGYARAREYGV
jgi:hypothetical protein